MLNAEQIAAGKASNPTLANHAYERGSIMFTRVILLGSTAIASFIAVMAWQGQLPGQTFSIEKEAELSFPYEHKFMDKSMGVMVPVKLGPSLFQRGIPPQLNMQISISADLKKIWEIEPEVVGIVDDGGKEEKRMDKQPLVVSDTSKSGQATVLLDGLAKDGRYVLKIYLHGREKICPSQTNVVEAIETISNKKGMRVVFLTKEKK